MPQMFPLMWFMLFSSSFLALLMVMTSLYFSASVNSPSLANSAPSKPHSWKW